MKINYYAKYYTIIQIIIHLYKLLYKILYNNSVTQTLNLEAIIVGFHLTRGIRIGRVLRGGCRNSHNLIP